MSSRSRPQPVRAALLAATLGLAGLAGFAGLVAFGGGMAGAQVAPTLHLVVDTPTDAVDAVPGDGICDDGSGHCTLRAALQETNRLAPVGTSTITLTTDVDLSIPPTGTDGEESGDLDVFGKVAIIGQKHRIHAHQIDRVIHEHLGKLNLSNVYIIGGVTLPDHPVGGGIWAEGFLNLNRVTLWANRAMGARSAGGAVYGSRGAIITV